MTRPSQETARTWRRSKVLHLAGSDPFRQGLDHRLGDLAGLGAAQAEWLPVPELVGRHDLQVAELCLRDQRLVGLGKGGRQVLHRLRAERTAERGEHGPRVAQRGLEFRPLAARDPAQELVDVQRLSVRLGVDERLQLGRQLLENVPGLSSDEALGQGLRGRLGGARGRVPARPATRLPDGLNDLLVVHPALRGACRSRPSYESFTAQPRATGVAPYPPSG